MNNNNNNSSSIVIYNTIVKSFVLHNYKIMNSEQLNYKLKYNKSIN